MGSGEIFHMGEIGWGVKLNTDLSILPIWRMLCPLVL